MRCRRARRLLAREPGALAAADRAALADHLPSCAGCRAARDLLADLGAALAASAGPPAEPPPGLIDRSVRAAWSRELATGRRPAGLAERLVGLGRFGLAGAACAALLLVALAAARTPGAPPARSAAPGAALPAPDGHDHGDRKSTR